MKEDFLAKKLDQRAGLNALRQLRLPEGNTDFCSNDYLGIATNFLIESSWPAAVVTSSGSPAAVVTSSAIDPSSGSPAAVDPSSAVTSTGNPDSARPSSSLPDAASSRPGQSSRPIRHGSGGSRLLAGNYALVEETERQLAAFHDAAAGLIFNSGYDANLGLLSSIPQRGDTILYDYLSHASIRDGIRLSFAQSFSFHHNEEADLEKKLQAAVAHPMAAAGHPAAASHPSAGNIFVVTESVFSMDGDQAPLQKMAALCATYGAHLIVDEAHATGVIGKKGEGLVQDLGLQAACFARVHTFGKAVGCHGAVVLGSQRLREYLINFSRAFIYTTSLPESSILAIRKAYELFPQMEMERDHLQHLIARFQQASLSFQRLDSTTPIQGVIVPGNEAVRSLAARLQAAGLDVRPILYPTVPKGSERLRIVLHAFNTTGQLDKLIAGLQ
ncbi:MAG TPA: 8-amino-7-oxononanoate synthase [Puia sp.]|nr:8-amino-7-oxononanoate synthase [Puia sp.]